MEEWKTLKKFPDYQISNYGRIRSIDRIIYYKDGRKRFYKGQIKNQILLPNGYFAVDFYHENNRQYVHRLVAENFIENPNNYKYVNHKDGNKKK